MCGRFTLTSPDLDTVAEALEASVPEEAASLYRPRYNVAPTDLHWIARTVGAARELSPAHWGLHGRRGPLINVRVESAPGQFREAWHARRCVVPADGFYEWTGAKAARRPIWFHAEHGYIYMAGLYDEDATGHLIFTILTAPADRAVAAVHDRMPLLLPRPQVDAWLAGARLDAPFPSVPLIGQPASPRVNKPENDDPACLSADAPAQGDLFKERG